ncbi:MAG TPA: MBL fold metallo-hydrolase [Candidatus Limnocylindrales bacterium]|jgi:phosphoribosyl 1,2-cyclic phosphodiesterase|nr:MBL fold metallo-hydrolase [Candidatus Limnocylindrales bacterium]
MDVTFWGTRGSIASAGAATQRYGGNTAAVQVTGRDGTVIVLDAGTGIREIGASLPPTLRRIDIFLSHLHMDHIQGLGFFGPMFMPSLEVHLWGPPSATLDLRRRLTRYLSPPLFPIRLRDLASHVALHNAPDRPVRIGGLEISAAEVIHPGPTVGYRIRENGSSMAYIPDHEPALGNPSFPDTAPWTSGHELAKDVDLLIHDVQYFPDERKARIGWGHCSTIEAAAFARQAGVHRLAAFHHDPAHDDSTLDRLVAEVADAATGVEVIGAREGETISL